MAAFHFPSASTSCSISVLTRARLTWIKCREKRAISWSSGRFERSSPPFPWKIKPFTLFHCSMTLSASWISCLSRRSLRYSHRKRVLITLYVRYNQGVRERSNPLSRPSLSYRRWPLKRVSFWEEATHEQSTLGVLPTGCRQRNGTSVVADPGTSAARSTNGRCLWARPERLPDLLCQTADCP